MKFRKGDRVLVEGEVSHVYPNGTVEVWVDRSVHVDISEKNLRMMAPAKLQAGDTVIHDTDESVTYTVLAVDQEQAWVKNTRSGARNTCLTARLVVVDRA